MKTIYSDFLTSTAGNFEVIKIKWILIYFPRKNHTLHTLLWFILRYIVEIQVLAISCRSDNQGPSHRPDIRETDVPARLLRLRRRQKNMKGGGCGSAAHDKLRPSRPGTTISGSSPHQARQDSVTIRLSEELKFLWSLNSEYISPNRFFRLFWPIRGFKPQSY